MQGLKAGFVECSGQAFLLVLLRALSCLLVAVRSLRVQCSECSTRSRAAVLEVELVAGVHLGTQLVARGNRRQVCGGSVSRTAPEPTASVLEAESNLLPRPVVRANPHRFGKGSPNASVEGFELLFVVVGWGPARVVRELGV